MTEREFHEWMNRQRAYTGRCPTVLALPWHRRDALLLRLEHHRRFMEGDGRYFPTSHDRLLICGTEIIESQ